MVEEPIVDCFDEIVSLLVDAVDCPLYGSDLAVGCGGISSLVLLMPEIEVGTMLLFDKGAERGVNRGDVAGLMPLSGPEQLRLGQLSQVARLG